MGRLTRREMSDMAKLPTTTSSDDAAPEGATDDDPEAREEKLPGAALLGCDLRVGFSFLTRLPVNLKPEDGERKLADAAWTFPIVGIAVGVVTATALSVGFWLGLHPLACGLLAVAAGVFFTGAMHEDGFADVADGFGGGADKRAKLRIMRDSRIGTYGVLALVLSVGLRAALLAGMAGPGRATVALMAAAIASRAVLPLIMNVLKPARRDGLGADAGRPQRADAVIAALIGSGLLLGLIELEAAISVILATAAAAFAVASVARRQIGGFTGDVLGAVQQVAEITILAAVASMRP
jgi:adenosylcobinamide-GDP ribazoletransferase